jgi:glutathione S-transferase
MPLILHFHPLSSFCWKALIALYEKAVRFEGVVVDLGDPASRARFAAVWPLAKMPVLQDTARGETVAEATVVVEYLDLFVGGAPRLIPEDRDLCWQVRMWDRVFDHYVQQPMQKIVGDALRPPDARDPAGVEQARDDLKRTYALLEARLGGAPGDGGWFLGEAFTLADCAAAPALFYANCVRPFGAAERGLAAYLARLESRPSVARVLREAEPFFGFFPLDPKPRIGATAR